MKEVTKVDIESRCGALSVSDTVRWYVGVFVLALILYSISCAPGILWQDSGLYQYRILHNDIEGGLGLALSHPLYHLVGMIFKHIPIGGFGYRVNMISAISGAFAVANVFLFVRLWLGRNAPAVVASLMLALSHTIWLHASIAEVYTLYAALYTAELVFLLQYFKTKRVGWLYLLGLFNGLSIANHMWGVIPLGCYGLFWLVLLTTKRMKIRDAVIIALLWIIGAAPYEYLIVKNIFESGQVGAVLASAAFGNEWQGDVLNASMSGRTVMENFMFMALNFPTPNILLFFVGCVGLFKFSPTRSFANVFAGMLILFFVFAFRYDVPDRFAFFIPFYCLASILTGVGAGLLFDRFNCKVLAVIILLLCLLPTAVFYFAPSLAKRLEVGIGSRGDVPYRDDYAFFLQPWKTGYRGSERFAEEALESVDRNAMIYADSTTVYPLLFAQELSGKRPDVTIVSWHGKYGNMDAYGAERIDELFSAHPVYAVSPKPRYCPDFLLERFDFVEDTILFKARTKQTDDLKVTQ